MQNRNRKASPASSQKVHSSKNDSPFISCTNLYGPPFVASGFDAAEVGEGEESPGFEGEGEGEGGGELGVFDFEEKEGEGELLPDGEAEGGFDEFDEMGFDCAKKSKSGSVKATVGSDSRFRSHRSGRSTSSFSCRTRR